VNTAYPFAAGYLVLGGGFDVRFVLGTIFFLIPYNLLMYGVNDVFDYESDIRNPRKGGVEGAVTAKEFHPLILWSSALSTIPFVAYLLATGSRASNITLLVVLFFVLAYSAPLLRFKERPFLDSATSSMHFVGPLLYALSLYAFPNEAAPFVVAFFCWGMASQSFGAVQDIKPDREAGISSIATFLGARRTVWFAATLYTLASVMVVLQLGYAAIVGLAGFLYVWNVSPYLMLTDKTSGRARAGWKRFLWINYIVGFVVTICLLLANI